MRALNSDLLNETMDADQGGSDFIDSLPSPEIKTTEDLIAAATPAAPAATPAAQPMMSGPVGRDGVQETETALSQTQGYGMVPVYQAQQGRGADRGPPVLIGYEFNPQAAGLTIEDAPKPPEILAREKQFGTTMEPLYESYQKIGPRGIAESDPMYYGPPIGYRFDNGKSQYVNFDISGQHTSTVNRNNNSGFLDFALSVLSIAYPPAAPFIQAYNAVKAIDKGDTLGFILNAAGAGRSIPGLDPSTVKLLNEVKTGAGVIQAVKTGDPLKILSATANIPGVDPDLKDVGIVLNTAKALKDGDITGAFNGISKMSDRDSVGRLTERFDDIVNSGDVAALDPSQVAALNPDEPIDDTLTNAGLVSSDVIDKTPEEQEQEDREQAAREAIRASEKTIEDQLTDAGLVSNQEPLVDTIAQEQADREQAARDAIKASERTIEDTLIDSGLVSTDDQDVQETERMAQEDREQAAREAIRAQEQTAQLAQEQEDREQAARDAVRASEKTIEDQLVDSGLVSKTDDEEKLKRVEVTGKALTDTDLPITDDKSRNTVTDSGLPITGDQGRNRVTDSNLPVNPNVGTTTPALERKEVSGKREIDTDLPITSDTGGNRVTDSNLPVDPNAGKPLQEFKPVTVTGKRDQELEPVTITEKRIVDEEPTPDGGALKPVTIIGKKETPVIPKPPVIPKVPTTTTKPTPAKPSPKKPATPAEQLYQTTTQSNPTTLADIKYYLDMASGGMVPPENPSDPLESLLNQPMSIEELLYYLRS